MFYQNVSRLVRFRLDLIRFNLLNWFVEIRESFFFEMSAFMRFGDFLDGVRVSYKHVRFYHIHQMPLLCDHQELACTPKHPPRRVDMKETSRIYSHTNNYCVINKTVWRPTLGLLATRFKARMCSYILINWIMWIECMLEELRLGRLGEPLGGSRENRGACSHLTVTGL